MSKIEPVAWMHDGFVSTNKARVEHDEMRNRSCGFKPKPMVELYTADALAAQQREINRLRGERDAAELMSLALKSNTERLRGERDSFYMDYRIKCDEETKRQAAEIERLRAALERAHDVWETEAAGMRDEIERLREDNETLNEIIEIHGVEINRLRSERDVAELMSLALKCDAERYRWLRGGPEVPPHSTRWPRWEVRYWDGRYWQTLFAEQLDAATDAAMKEGK